MTTVAWTVAAIAVVWGVAEWVRANAEEDRADEAETDAAEYRALYRESVARESLHLMGPLTMWGPLDEGTPIADALHIQLWDAQMEGEQ